LTQSSTYASNFATQVSQYTFAICSYKEKKSDPSEMMQLDGYTVDYIEPAGGRLASKAACRDEVLRSNAEVQNVESQYVEKYLKNVDFICPLQKAPPPQGYGSPRRS
jgi:hypothetical protein